MASKKSRPSYKTKFKAAAAIAEERQVTIDRLQEELGELRGALEKYEQLIKEQSAEIAARKWAGGITVSQNPSGVVLGIGKHKITVHGWATITEE